jgi:hypothetical protein
MLTLPLDAVTAPFVFSANISQFSAKLTELSASLCALRTPRSALSFSFFTRTSAARAASRVAFFCAGFCAGNDSVVGKYDAAGGIFVLADGSGTQRKS